MKAFKTVTQLIEEITLGSFDVRFNAKADLKAKADTHIDFMESTIESGKDAISFYIEELGYSESQAFKAYQDNRKAYEISTAFTHDVI